jgi:hypothetical protein
LDSFLVSLGGASLFRKDESSSNPDSAGTELKSGSERLAIEETTGGNDLHGLTGQWALVALDELSNGGDENGGWDVAGVATTLTSLGANEINSELEALLDVLGVADHVHVKDASLVELVNDGLGWDTDGRNEETSTRLNDNVNKGVELALGVIVAIRASAYVVVWSSQALPRLSEVTTHLVLRAFPPT